MIITKNKERPAVKAKGYLYKNLLDLIKNFDLT